MRNGSNCRPLSPKRVDQSRQLIGRLRRSELELPISVHEHLAIRNPSGDSRLHGGLQATDLLLRRQVYHLDHVYFRHLD